MKPLQFSLLEDVRREHAARQRRAECRRHLGSALFMVTLWVALCLVCSAVLYGFIN